MDYKKIIAATAVTSAAFVVPVVADAEGETEVTPYSGLITDGNSGFGKTITVSTSTITNTVTGTDGEAGTVVETIKTYEWYIVSGNTETKLSNTSKTLTVPFEANGKEIKLVVTTNLDNKYSDIVNVKVIPEVSNVFFDEDGGAIVNALVNSTIYAKEINTPDKADAITGYQWYVIEDGKYRLLTGETDTEIDIPIEFQGRDLMFLILTEGGNYYSSELNIKPLEIAKKDNGQEYEIGILVNGKEKSESQELIPGDVISVKNIDLSGINGEKLASADVDVSYKWYAINESDNKIAFSTVTGASLTVPLDSEKNGYKAFYVEVRATVPAVSASFPYGKNIVIDKEKLPKLNSRIAKLIENVDDDSINEVGDSFDSIKAEVKSLVDEYNNLPVGSKSAIKNFTQLNAIYKNIQLVSSLVEEFTKFEDDRNVFDESSIDSELKQSDLLKRLEKIRKTYSSFTKQQRILFDFYLSESSKEASYLEQLYEWLKKSDASDSSNSSEYTTINSIEELNYTIVAKLNTSTKVYEINTMLEQDKALKEFEDELKKLLNKAASFNKTYQPLIKTVILKTAQTDIKKAQSVIDKMKKIELATKKASALDAAQKAYNKLNSYQASLILDISALTSEDETGSDVNEKVADLIDRIAYIQPNDSGKYEQGYEELEKEIIDIKAEYKLLKSEKKQVTNYTLVSQVNKDMTAAKKVALLIDKAFEIHSEATGLSEEQELKKLKSAQSKYSSAYKAYIKLTPLQLSILENSELENGIVSDFVSDYEELTELVKTPVFKVDDVKAEEKFSKKKYEDVVKLIADIEETLNSASAGIEAPIGLFATLDAQIKEVKIEYGNLTSYEKKLVHNYAVISVASSNLNKAKAVQKKLQDATDKKKMLAAVTAYKKLTATQQGLIVKDYNEVSLILDIPVVTKDDITLLIEDIESDYSVESINYVTNAMKGLSSKEQKAISKYSIYEAALKDLKVVESFIAKMDKLGETPTYSQKDTIYKAYLKLTAKQAVLFDIYKKEDGQIPSKTLATWMEELTDSSKDLNTRIGQILVNGIYQADIDLEESAAGTLTNFDNYLTDLEKEYKALDSKEKKLVTHYSFIATAKKDSKAVRPVVLLAEKAENAKSEEQDAINKQWANAYNRLTAQQQSLYELSGAELH